MAQKKKPGIVKKQNFQKKPDELNQQLKKEEQVRTVEPIKSVQQRTRHETKKPEFLFGRLNYLLMLGGLVLIALGFILMIGGGSDDPGSFNPEIFNARRLTLAPILVLLGYAVEIVAIMIKPKEKEAS